MLNHQPYRRERPTDRSSGPRMLPADIAERIAVEQGRSVDPLDPPAVRVDPAIAGEAALTFAYAVLKIEPMKVKRH